MVMVWATQRLTTKRKNYMGKTQRQGNREERGASMTLKEERDLDPPSQRGRMGKYKKEESLPFPARSRHQERHQERDRREHQSGGHGTKKHKQVV